MCLRSTCVYLNVMGHQFLTGITEDKFHNANQMPASIPPASVSSNVKVVRQSEYSIQLSSWLNLREAQPTTNSALTGGKFELFPCLPLPPCLLLLLHRAFFIHVEQLLLLGLAKQRPHYLSIYWVFLGPHYPELTGCPQSLAKFWPRPGPVLIRGGAKITFIR